MISHYTSQHTAAPAARKDKQTNKRTAKVNDRSIVQPLEQIFGLFRQYMLHIEFATLRILHFPTDRVRDIQ